MKAEKKDDLFRVPDARRASLEAAKRCKGLRQGKPAVADINCSPFTNQHVFLSLPFRKPTYFAVHLHLPLSFFYFLHSLLELTDRCTFRLKFSAHVPVCGFYSPIQSL